MPNCSTKQVDPIVWQWVKETIADPEKLEARLHYDNKQRRASHPALIEQIQGLREELQEYENQLERAAIALIEARLNSELYDRITDNPRKCANRLKEAIEEQEKQLPQPLSDDEISALRRGAEQLKLGLAKAERDFELRRRFIEALDVKATVECVGDEYRLRATSRLCSDGIFLPIELKTRE